MAAFDRELPIDNAPVPYRENVERLTLPIDIDDEPVISDPELVALDGAQPLEEPRRVLCRLFELANDSDP